MSDQIARILIVDDDPIVTQSLAEYLAEEGYDIAVASDGAAALEILNRSKPSAAASPDEPFGVVITDGNMPVMDGLHLLRETKNKHPDIVVIVLTAYATVESAVECVKEGAFDYLTKPVVDQELLIAVQKAVRQQALIAENHTLRSQLDTRFGLDNIIGADPRMTRTYDLIEAVAPGKTTVLMGGESGTGKSLIAHAIHRRSPRRNKPFVEVSCGSIPETLLESELFGHVKGAFTGAHADKIGRFLAADGGTLFLDEINSASPGMQLKLLRILQERRFEPVGSTETVEVDVRVILASNEPLEELVASGQFRQDLYYRINVVMIDLPPLRERIGDIPLLAEHFLRRHCEEVGTQITGFTAEAMEALQRYDYPGNVRELGNIVERAVVLTRGQTITLDDLTQNVLDRGASAITADNCQATGLPWLGDDGDWQPMSLRQALEEPERQILLAALRANDWNRQKTSDELEINRTTLYKKIKQYGLDRLAG
ncbi:MAG: sigma-54-dependent Fis family transcriptional regulator [Phycisphaerales bacterium]|nr:sigma-54-dependent Fis family transcriptional regulator [Phycisphaerales bacterium]